MTLASFVSGLSIIHTDEPGIGYMYGARKEMTPKSSYSGRELLGKLLLYGAFGRKTDPSKVVNLATLYLSPSSLSALILRKQTVKA